MLRILFSSVSFVVTLIIGAIAFAATAIHFPAIMRDLIAMAQQLPGYLANLGLSNDYLVWVDILLSGDKLVLLGFVLAARILVSIVASVFAPLFERDMPRASFVSTPRAKMSPFHKWGGR
jgi:hypothetical protein